MTTIAYDRQNSSLHSSVVWQNLILYWAWRGDFLGTTQPPTYKMIQFGIGEFGEKQAVGVFDCHSNGEVDYTPL